jgi:hypothetical protein
MRITQQMLVSSLHSTVISATMATRAVSLNQKPINGEKACVVCPRGIGLLGNLTGGRLGDFGYSVERGGDILSERFEGQTPSRQKEHENAFNQSSE